MTEPMMDCQPSICSIPAVTGIFETKQHEEATPLDMDDLDMDDKWCGTSEPDGLSLELLDCFEPDAATGDSDGADSLEGHWIQPEFENTLNDILKFADKQIKQVLPSEAVTAVVPDLMDDTLPLEVRMAAEMDQLRVPQPKPRRKRKAVPSSKKDDLYYVRRAKNNAAAAANRAKEKVARTAMKALAQELSLINKGLKAEVQSLEDELVLLRNQRAVQRKFSLSADSSLFSGLAKTEYSLTPPVVACL